MKRSARVAFIKTNNYLIYMTWMITKHQFFINNFLVFLVFLSRLLIIKLLKKHTEIWERVSSLMNIEFDSEPVDGDKHKYIKKKIMSMEMK